jgi:YggT family protein
MFAVGQLIYWALQLFLLALLIRVVFDYLRMFSPNWRPKGIVMPIAEIIYTLTDPPLRFVRRFVPPLRLGPVALDLSFIVVFFVVQILARIVFIAI